MAGLASRILVTVRDEGGSTHEDELRLTPKILMAVERQYPKGIPALEGTFYGAWLALGKPGGPRGFDAWVDTVEDARPAEEPEEGGDDAEAPFPQGASSVESAT